MNIPITDAWKFGSGSGTAQVDGETVVYAGFGASFSQDLGISPAKIQAMPGKPAGYIVEGIYTLSFSVASKDRSYPGYFTAEIDFGTQELGETSGWGVQKLTRVSASWPCPGYIVVDKSLPGGGPVQGASNLVLHITVNDGSQNGGWPLLFTDFSLEFTPNA
jgi:hypothetical protein